MKIKIVVLIAAICFVIVPLAVRAVLSNYYIQADSAERYTEEVKAMAKNQVVALQTILDIAEGDMNKITSYSYIDYATNNLEILPPVEDFVVRMQDSNAMINAVRIIDSSGNVLAGTGSGSELDNYAKYNDYEDNVLYFDTVSDSSGSAKTMFYKRNLNKCMIIISYNVSTSNSLLSKVIGNSAFDTQGKSDGGIVVVDSKGYWSSGMGFYSDFESTYSGVNLDSVPDNSASNVFKFKVQDTNRIGAAARVGGENGLVVVVSCLTNDTGLFVSSSMPLIIGAAILLAVLGVVGAIIASNKIAQPLNKIENTLEKIRRGDHEARISTISNNEYGQLSRAFNNLVDEIVISEDRYKTISDMSDNIIFEWNFKTNEVTFSNNFNKKFSYRPPSDHFGDSFLLKAKIHSDDQERYRADLDALEKGKNFERNEYRIKNIYGDFIWVLIRTSTLKDKDGKPLKVVGVMVDINRAKESEEKLTERASYDALTELYNRETIEQKINTEISLSEMRKSEMAVLFIDVDDFKHYNDNYSHATGDEVLKFVGKTLREAVGEEGGFAGRFGGDEFILLVRNAEENNPAAIAQKIIDTLAAGFEADIGERLSVSVSIGIAAIKDDYNTRVEYLIGKADDAMYSVKKSGKSNYAFL